jgi:hypothetical protein
MSCKWLLVEIYFPSHVNYVIEFEGSGKVPENSPVPSIELSPAQCALFVIDPTATHGKSPRFHRVRLH